MNLQTQVFLLLLGQILTIGVLIVTNNINRRHTKKILEDKIQVEKNIDYLEKQLTTFYSPIYSLLKINKEIIKTKWDPETRQDTNKVPEEIWKDLRDCVLIPNNLQIVDLLKKNLHLIEGPEIHECYTSFIVHAEVWPLFCKHNTDFGKYLLNFSYPQEFSDLIFKTTEQLKQDYMTLIKKGHK